MSQRFNSVNTMFVELEAEFVSLTSECDELREKLAAFEREAEDIAVIHAVELRRVVRQEQMRLADRLRTMFKEEYANALAQQLGIDFKHVPDAGSRSAPPFPPVKEARK